MITIGALLSAVHWEKAVWWLVPLLLGVPVAVHIGLIGWTTRRDSAGFPSIRFGIRGIGSLYYLMYALGVGLPPALAEETYAGGHDVAVVVATSMVTRGVSVTPLIAACGRRAGAQSPKRERRPGLQALRGCKLDSIPAGPLPLRLS